jgi:hypothetical protein
MDERRIPVEMMETASLSWFDAVPREMIGIAEMGTEDTGNSAVDEVAVGAEARDAGGGGTANGAATGAAAARTAAAGGAADARVGGEEMERGAAA